MFKENQRHFQLPLTSNVDELPPKLIETSNRIRTNDRAITIAMEKGALESRLPKMGFELIG